jgi:hypothetical protein
MGYVNFGWKLVTVFRPVADEEGATSDTVRASFESAVPR